MDYFGQFGGNRQRVLSTLLPYVERMLIAHHQADYITFISLATKSFKQAVNPASFFYAHKTLDPALGKPMQLNFKHAFERNRNPVLAFEVEYRRAPMAINVHVEFCNQTFPPKINYLTIE